MEKNRKRKRALVLSGGGSMGAWAGGVIQHLIEDLEKDYDIFIGTSTGSLLAPLTSIREIEILKEGYTNIRNQDIFNISPFTKKGKPNLFRMLLRAVMLKKTFGESKTLRETIKRYFKEEHFERLKRKEKEVIAVVANLTDEKMEYKSSLNPDMTYEDFVDWLWASCNAEMYTSILEKNGNEYADGAIYQDIPIQIAIDNDATDIDVIVLSPEGFGVVKRTKVSNVIHYYHKTLRMMQARISKYNLMNLNSRGRDINIRVYYTPYRLTENSLVFDKDEMLKWWEEGYISAEKGDFKHYRLTKSNHLKEVDD